MSAYGASKAAAEMADIAAAAQGARVVRVRPFNHTGPGQRSTVFVPTLVQQLAAIRSGDAEPVLHQGDLTAVHDMSDVRDVIRAYPPLLWEGESDETYNVGRGAGTRKRDTIDFTLNLIDLHIDVGRGPNRMRPSDLPFLVSDVDRLHRSISWTHERTLERTLRDRLTAAEEAPAA